MCLRQCWVEVGVSCRRTGSAGSVNRWMSQRSGVKVCVCLNNVVMCRCKSVKVVVVVRR